MFSFNLVILRKYIFDEILLDEKKRITVIIHSRHFEWTIWHSPTCCRKNHSLPTWSCMQGAQVKKVIQIQIFIKVACNPFWHPSIWKVLKCPQMETACSIQSYATFSWYTLFLQVSIKIFYTICNHFQWIFTRIQHSTQHSAIAKASGGWVAFK